MVWSVEDQTCLANIISRASHIRGELATCYFSPQQRALFIATDTLALLQLRQKDPKNGSSFTSHNATVLCCQYNTRLQQVISCSEGSVVKIWDLNTGAPVSTFDCPHERSAVTCMTLDNSGNRFITGGRDGSLRKWDYSTGGCVSIIRQGTDVSDEANRCIQVDIHSNRYIISVGCDKWISIFPDPEDGCKGVQNIGKQWLGQESFRHHEDIVSVDLWPPNLLATSSCGAEVLVWNLVSGSLFCQLGSLPSPLPSEPSDEDLNVCKVLFIPSRAPLQKTAAILVTSGPGGCIHLWNIFGGGRLFGKFSGSPQQATVTDLALGKGDTLLLSADQLGWLRIWDIAGFAQHGPETTDPTLLCNWRAHACSITSVVCVPEQQLAVTSAKDCLLRLWSHQGELIGTFGQEEHWDVRKKETWRQELPEDLRVLTEEPVLQGALRSRPPSDTGIHTEGTMWQEALSSPTAQDIEEELQTYQPSFRVRGHLTQVDIPQVSGRLMTYQTLHWYELDDVHKEIHKPDPAAELNDPYDFSF
nr:PREDICTED: WD repeat-containing protein 49-like [Lepisosteus oculatus]